MFSSKYFLVFVLFILWHLGYICFLTSKHNGIFLLFLLLHISHLIALGLESVFYIYYIYIYIFFTFIEICFGIQYLVNLYKPSKCVWRKKCFFWVLFSMYVHQAQLVNPVFQNFYIPIDFLLYRLLIEYVKISHCDCGFVGVFLEVLITFTLYTLEALLLDT